MPTHSLPVCGTSEIGRQGLARGAPPHLKPVAFRLELQSPEHARRLFPSSIRVPASDPRIASSQADGSYPYCLAVHGLRILATEIAVTLRCRLRARANVGDCRPWPGRLDPEAVSTATASRSVLKWRTGERRVFDRERRSRCSSPTALILAELGGRRQRSWPPNSLGCSSISRLRPRVCVSIPAPAKASLSGLENGSPTWPGSGVAMIRLFSNPSIGVPQPATFQQRSMPGRPQQSKISPSRLAFMPAGC